MSLVQPTVSKRLRVIWNTNIRGSYQELQPGDFPVDYKTANLHMQCVPQKSRPSSVGANRWYSRPVQAPTHRKLRRPVRLGTNSQRQRELGKASARHLVRLRQVAKGSLDKEGGDSWYSFVASLSREGGCVSAIRHKTFGKQLAYADRRPARKRMSVNVDAVPDTVPAKPRKKQVDSSSTRTAAATSLGNAADRANHPITTSHLTTRTLPFFVIVFWIF